MSDQDQAIIAELKTALRDLLECALQLAASGNDPSDARRFTVENTTDVPWEINNARRLLQRLQRTKLPERV